LVGCIRAVGRDELYVYTMGRPGSSFNTSSMRSVPNPTARQADPC
jgi:hypothetical protein